MTDYNYDECKTIEEFVELEGKALCEGLSKPFVDDKSCPIDFNFNLAYLLATSFDFECGTCFLPITNAVGIGDTLYVLCEEYHITAYEVGSGIFRDVTVAEVMNHQRRQAKEREEGYNHENQRRELRQKAEQQEKERQQEEQRLSEQFDEEQRQTGEVKQG